MLSSLNTIHKVVFDSETFSVFQSTNIVIDIESTILDFDVSDARVFAIMSRRNDQ